MEEVQARQQEVVSVLERADRLYEDSAPNLPDKVRGTPSDSGSVPRSALLLPVK